MTTEKMVKTVQERITALRENEKIEAKYQAYWSKEAADEWITKAAIATLMVSVEDRGNDL